VWPHMCATLSSMYTLAQNATNIYFQHACELWSMSKWTVLELAVGDPRLHEQTFGEQLCF